MSLVRYNENRLADPFRGILTFDSGIDRLLDFWRGDTSAPAWTPGLDVREDKANFVVTVDLPGVEKDAIHITVEGDVLTLRGERKSATETKDGDVLRSERFHGSFVRSLTLPSEINAEQVKAAYKNGVLEITLPKTEAARPKEIAVVAQ